MSDRINVGPSPTNERIDTNTSAAEDSGFSVKVDFMDGRRYTFRVQITDKVEDLQSRVSELSGMEPRYTMLFFAGKAITNEREKTL